MITELKIKDRKSRLEIIERNANLLKIKVDDKAYDLDIIQAGVGVYSVLLDGKSYNIEIVKEDDAGRYSINIYNNTYCVEIIDSQKRYQSNRKGTGPQPGTNTIISPMPGKVVKIIVKEGDAVETGQIVLVISAMKMESEFKAVADGVVKKIYIKEGDTVEGNKILMVIE